MMSVGAGDVRAAPVVADPAAVMRPGNARMSRLDAIAIARSTPSVQLTAELRRVAVDASDDAIVRATAIAVLAERGETVTVENNPPPAVVSALKKAGRIVATQRLVASFEQGQSTGSMSLPPLLMAPSTGTSIDPVPADPQTSARVIAASTLRPASTVTGAGLQVVLLRCGGNELAVVADPARLRPAELLKRPARPAQLGMHQTSDDDVWTMPFEVVTRPEGAGIRIVVLDDQGTTRFAGEGHDAGSQAIVFTLYAAAAPGATPVRLAGRIDDGKLTIEPGTSGAAGPTPQRPARIKTPR